MPSGEEGKQKWLDLAAHLRDLSWTAVHTCEAGASLEASPGCTACSLLLAARNVTRDCRRP